ncbi:isoleucine--tRNA ligase [Evansella cellulosilytica]|uniref:Isoleucine--tRNA ligase n=1 Tax=Evansella cellulosilytica (strain ATCC 21833 / DSM 2522 / FERM P-1141 / JCM 9156 / N-4) TaxID=649639 RepID=E6TQY3_EVAC2|nr:isoleucine--tRNA ligase [Evansella cellulosilytica]ADU29359.1 isoleucyl-tRNA synthetase [Evansella cellulosilytica DSM 2522]
MQKVNVNEKAIERENRIQSYWDSNNIFQKSVTNREGRKTFVFYEGPPTANGLPHAGHVLGRVIKDFVARYQTMRGHQVIRKAGWDTHGLPVELGVEKKIGVSGKQEIEEYGVENFINECKKSVFDYEKQWRKFTEAIGYWVDMDNPYVTLNNDYIESVWYVLSKIHEKGLLYRGHRVTPYCPSCQTSLSSHEVAQGYKDVKDLSATAKFKVEGKENEYFLGWTTTPWTLPSNVALGVHDEIDYVKAEQHGDIYILAKNLVKDILGENFNVISEHKGRELVGITYEPPFNYLTLERGHEVISATFVTDDSGTGIVHLAPAHGEDDYNAIKESGLDFVNIVDEKGCYTDDIKPLAGEFTKDCDVKIIKLLSDEGLLFSKEKYEHSYPHCWRCDSPLIYYAMEGWFIRTTEIKETILKNNQTVEWHPDHMKDGRFGKFLENMVDWNLGRNRYWGTPLNVWVCEECNHQYVPGSIQDLKVNAKSGMVENLELHKPYVDEVIVECPCCSKDMRRTKEVIDVWFDSGSMPFAQYHYPFENKQMFHKQFPADVIAEGVDQTRGWFYSLLTVSSLFTGKAPYKRVLSLGHILDEDGRKMSKSKGNVIDPIDLVKNYGADALRWALLADSAPWNNKRFSENVVSQAKSKLVDTLNHVHSFYTLYAEIDGFDPNKHEQGERSLLDKWVLSRLNTVTKNVKEHLDNYDFTAGAREISLLVDQVSNWYIRRSRERFWSEGLNDDKLAAYHTLFKVLVRISRLLAPFTPFIAEDIHLNLTSESVHLSDFTKANEEEVNLLLEIEMDSVLQVVELARATRNMTNIKTKLPLSMLTVVGSKNDTDLLRKYEYIIKDEINVKKVQFTDHTGDSVQYELKLNFPTAGPKLGKLVGVVQKTLKSLTPEDTRKIVEQGYFETDSPTGEKVQVEKNDLIVSQKTHQGLEMASNTTFSVFLNTTITDDLRKEGKARELIRSVQQYRKELNLPVEQRVKLVFDVDESMKEVIEQFKDLLQSNLLIKSLEYNKQDDMKLIVIDGAEMGIHVEE